jgi:glycosyltransferase involved in cell wall biosynthesis
MTPAIPPESTCPAMPERRYRVLAVATHPVQYMAPIFRRMANHSALHLHVSYCTLRGAEAAHDPEFGASVKWDVPLLDGYAWTHVPNHGSGADSFFGLFNPGIWKLIRTGNFDAVLCFTGYRCTTFWIALLAAKLSKTTFLFGADATTLAPRDGNRWKIMVKKTLWPLLFRLADQVIVPSSGSLDLMLSLGLPSERVTITPYSVDNDWWIQQSSRVDRSATRTAWGASPNDAVILFCAKLQPWKRPLDLLRAFAKAKPSKALLVFAGEGPLRPQLESEAVALGASSRVRFLGFVNQSQLPAVYTSADLMVLPSEYEPFAVVVNEAMCCGCPVIASDHVGAARDLVAPVAAEFVFPSGNVDRLATILKDAVTDRTRLQSVARAAVAHIQTWSPERNIAATVDAIRIAVARLRGARNEETAPSQGIPKKSSVHPQTRR